MRNQPPATAIFLTSATGAPGFPPPLLPEVAFVGRSNVGKSSLLNRLAGRRLAHVSRTPGRTRMVNFFEIGKSHRLVDLPGYGFARVPDAMRAGWEAMVLAYLEGRESLVLSLLLVDPRRDPMEKDRQAFRLLLASGRPAAVVATKSDKLKRSAVAVRLRILREAYGEAGAVPVIACSTLPRRRRGRRGSGPSGIAAVRRLIAERVASWR